jgi:predicted permease
MQAILQIASSVYLPILAATLTGFLLSFLLSRKPRLIRGVPIQERIPDFLARFLYLVGIPIGVANFIRKAEFNSSVWLSPVVAWVSVLLAIFLSWLILRSSTRPKSTRTKSSFVILSYLGNTSYLGFPIILLLPQLGPQYFSSAVLYDILGTLLAGYGLGVFIARSAAVRSGSSKALSAASLSEGYTKSQGAAVDSATGDVVHKPVSSLSLFLDSLVEIVKNPTFYAFFVGLYLKTVPMPDGVVTGLNAIAWGSIMVALVVMGMRAQQLQSGGDLKLAFQPVLIKTILVPLIIGAGLTAFGFDGPQRLVLVLQASMPCAFASLVLAENYDLDLNLTVASILLACIVFAFTMPIWVVMFTTW